MCAGLSSHTCPTGTPRYTLTSFTVAGGEMPACFLAGVCLGFSEVNVRIAAPVVCWVLWPRSPVPETESLQHLPPVSQPDGWPFAVGGQT